MSGKRSLLLIRGDTVGPLGAIKAYWPIFYLSRLWQHRGYRPRVLVRPTVDEAIEQIARADAVVFYGHGNPGAIWLGYKRTNGLRRDDVLKIAELRRQRGLPLLDFVHIACCQTCKDPAWVAAWLEAAEYVRGYEADTYDPRRPFSIPVCETYRKPSQSENDGAT